MDRFSIPLRQHPRRLPARLAVAQVGYIGEKVDVVAHGFGTINFSFVLRGGGFYDLHGERHVVKAPCVFVEYPGESFHYGPHEGATWDELYLMYDAEHRRELERAGLLDLEKPIWSVGESRGLAELSRELRELVNQGPATLSADRIDRVCERLIVESLLSEGRSAARGPEAFVREIKNFVEQHYLEEHDFAALAQNQGLSSTHFRRLWNSLVGVPPGRYVNELRLRQACRLLVESKTNVARIAEEMGFSDPLYFSRKFRTFTGENPTSYRKRYSVREI